MLIQYFYTGYIRLTYEYINKPPAEVRHLKKPMLWFKMGWINFSLQSLSLLRMSTDQKIFYLELFPRSFFPEVKTDLLMIIDNYHKRYIFLDGGDVLGSFRYNPKPARCQHCQKSRTFTGLSTFINIVFCSAILINNTK